MHVAPAAPQLDDLGDARGCLHADEAIGQVVICERRLNTLDVLVAVSRRDEKIQVLTLVKIRVLMKMVDFLKIIVIGIEF